MYLDSLSNKVGIPARFEKELRFLREHDLSNREVGRHALDGDNLFFIVAEHETKVRDLMRFEYHAKYADIQYVVSGEERMGFLPASARTDITEDRLEPDDIGFCDTTGTPSQLIVSAGMYCIFLPGELHAPGGAVSLPAHVRKIIMKVRVN